MRRSLAERFWEKVAVGGPDDCWEWQAGINSQTGYGHCRVGEGTTKEGAAHRVAYRLAKGKIPDGLWILHSCHNRRCVNPAHLRAGTPKENTQDMISSGRHGWKEDRQPIEVDLEHGTWKPSEKKYDVPFHHSTIIVNLPLIKRRMTDMGIQRGDLAEKAGITDMTLRHIMRGNDCKLTTLANIAYALGINASELLIVNGHTEPESVTA